MTNIQELPPSTKRAVWQHTAAEIYEAIYAALVRSLKRGATVPTRVGDNVYVLTHPSHIRQGVSPREFQIRIGAGWVNVFTETVDEWARTFDLPGPTEHFHMLKSAIKEGYPIHADLVAEYKRMAGIDRKSERFARRAQPTRSIGEDGMPTANRVVDRPVAGAKVEYHLSRQKSVILTVKEILAYRPFDMLWRVSVAENENTFFVQRVQAEGGVRWSVMRSKC